MSNVAQTVASVLQGQGHLSKAGAAGVLGNFQQESSLNPSSAGGYLGQWQGSRAQNLAAFAAARGKPVTDAATQAAFTLHELQSMPGLLHTLQTTNDPQAAALAFSQQYERPGDPMNQNRTKYAQQLLGQIGGAEARPIALGGQPAISQTPGTPTITNESIPDKQAIVQEMLKEQAEKPIDTTGHVSNGGASLSRYVQLLNSGQYNVSVAQSVPSATVTASAVNAAANNGAPHDAQVLLNMLHQVVGGGYNQANHSAAGESAQVVKARGTDCSGLISWLMGPTGLKVWNTSYATPDIETAPGIQNGRGKTVTIWNNKQAGNAGHVFIQIGNQFFASEGGGAGIRQISTAEAQNYITNGSDGGHYDPVHPEGL